MLPPGHPQGYQGCFDAVVADTYEAIWPAVPPRSTGCPPLRTRARRRHHRRRPALGPHQPLGRRPAKLGFITACLPRRTLPQLCEWAGRGLRGAGGRRGPDLWDRPFTATHLAVERFGDAEADATRELFAKHGLELSSIALYDNNLHPDSTERDAINEHLARCIDAAALVGLPHRRHLRGPRSHPVGGGQPAGGRGCSSAGSTVPARRA